MKNSILLTGALAFAAVSAPAFAGANKADGSSRRAPAPRPVASSIVSPTGLPREYVGLTVHVSFNLDASGRPQNIHVLWERNDILERQLIAAISRWRFELAEPAALNKRYILPVELKEA